MFTHVVFLKVSPWFLYATSYENAMSLCSQFNHDVSGVVVGKDLIVKHPEFRMTLEQKETLQVAYLDEPKEGEVQEEHEVEINKIEVSKEIEDELDKELESRVD